MQRRVREAATLWALYKWATAQRRLNDRITTGSVGVLWLRNLGVEAPDDTVLYGIPDVEVFPGSSICLGRRVTLTSRSTHTALGVNHAVVLRTLTRSARIQIADDAGISGGSICASRLVSIGAGTMLGANVTVSDTDFHPVHHRDRRHAPLPEPLPGDEVVIGRNVFIGTNSLILKGVNIGENAVVGAGSVVTRDVPANTVVAGNPAKALRPGNPL